MKRSPEDEQLFNSLIDQINQLQETIAQLNEQIKNLNRRSFGTSSEKTSAGQTSIFDDDSFIKAETTAEKTDEIIVKTHTRKKHNHQTKFIGEVEKKKVVTDLNDSEKQCFNCQHKLKKVGTRLDHIETELIPAKLEIVEYYTTTYKCDNCEDEDDHVRFTSSQAPKPAIQSQFTSASSIAWLLHQKFELSIPLYRQEKEWRSYGLDVDRKTLANWQIKATQMYLSPIYECMKSELLTQSYLHADETPYQILRRSDGRAATSESRMWVFTSREGAEHPIIIFHSALTRKQEVVEKFLQGYTGTLLTDGYTAYRNLPVKHAVCYAHLRRKFRDANATPGLAAIGVDYCNQLFILEHEFKNLTADERSKERQEKSAPILKKFWDWVETLSAMKGNLKTVIDYARNLKDELSLFLQDGNIALSNNIAERAIRLITVGRKNWNFSTSEAGATSNAVIYSLVQTAKENGLNVYKYLQKILRELPSLRFVQHSELLEAYLPWSKTIQATCR